MLIALASLILAAPTPSVPPPDLPLAVYRDRRERVMHELDGCLAVLTARGEMSGVTEDYRQDGNFLWLTGIIDDQRHLHRFVEVGNEVGRARRLLVTINARADVMARPPRGRGTARQPVPGSLARHHVPSELSAASTAPAPSGASGWRNPRRHRAGSMSRADQQCASAIGQIDREEITASRQEIPPVSTRLIRWVSRRSTHPTDRGFRREHDVRH